VLGRFLRIEEMSNYETIVGNTETPKPSIIQDPFELINIQKVFIHSRKMSFGDSWYHMGEVSFRRGNTEGSQTFKGTNMDDVIYQIKQFLKQLDEHEK
jgi:hypothetical protein